MPNGETRVAFKGVPADVGRLYSLSDYKVTEAGDGWCGGRLTPPEVDTTEIFKALIRLADAVEIDGHIPNKICDCDCCNAWRAASELIERIEAEQGA
jgi:hypothetical protein